MVHSIRDGATRSILGGVSLLGAFTISLFAYAAFADDGTVNLGSAIESLQSSDAAIQMIGVGQLRSLGSSELKNLAPIIIPPLSTALQSKNSEVRKGILLILDDMGTEAAPGVPALIKVIDGIHDDERLQAICVMENIGPGAKAAIPILIETLDDKDQSMRDRAIKVLAEIGPDARDAVPSLVQILRAGALTSGAETALASIGPAALPALLEGLTEKEASCRRLCVTGLTDMKDRPDSVIPEIAKMLKDGEFDVAREACWALEKIGPPARLAVPELILEMKDKSEYLRQFAADALGAIGPGAKDALPVLNQALTDEPVRRNARSAIKKIELGDAE